MEFSTPDSHKLLISIQNKDKREYYIHESENNKTILAGKYELYLPTENQLLTEIKKELDSL